MSFQSENQEKFYCDTCTRILSNKTRYICSCGRIDWCITCMNYQQKCSECKTLICNNYGCIYASMTCVKCSPIDSFKKIASNEIKKMVAEEIMYSPMPLLKIGMDSPKDTTMNLSGKIVVITGRLKSMKRKWAESLVITSGGDVGSAVSRNTDFVVVGENPGSKLDRAQELDIRIITEKEFLVMAEKKVYRPIKIIEIEPIKKRRILLL